MRSFFQCLLLLLFMPGVSCRTEKNTTKKSNSGIYEGLEFEMPVVRIPEFPDNVITITDFHAVGDGQILNTKAISDAIEYLSGKGGGKLIIPRGIWLTGPIILKSNINIHAEAGALVIFSKDKSLYELVETSFEGYNTVRCQSPISGKNLVNIAFTGEGIFDGSGDAWRQVKRSKLTSSQWKDLLASGGVVNEKGDTWYPSEGFLKGEQLSEMNVPRQFKALKEFESIKDFLRPVMVSLINCKKVMLDGPTFQNSPAWCIHPLMCEDLTVRNVSVRNPWYSQNGDGLDIESCKNSLIYDCRFDVGDDAICIKSGKDEDGRKRGIPTENLVVKNCVVYHGHGGVTIGSEMSGGVRNMHVSECTFIGTDVGLRFKSNRGRGGVVENIYISNVDMMNIPTQAISFNLYYAGKSVSEMLAESSDPEKLKVEIPPVTDETPVFRNITMKNITCKGALQAIFLQGLPEMNLKNIHLENLVMEADEGLFCTDADGITIANLMLKTKNKPAAIFYNAANVELKALSLTESDTTLIAIQGSKSENIIIRSEFLSENQDAVSRSEEVPADAVQITKQ